MVHCSRDVAGLSINGFDVTAKALCSTGIEDSLAPLRCQLGLVGRCQAIGGPRSDRAKDAWPSVYDLFEVTRPELDATVEQGGGLAQDSQHPRQAACRHSCGVVICHDDVIGRNAQCSKAGGERSCGRQGMAAGGRPRWSRQVFVEINEYGTWQVPF